MISMPGRSRSMPARGVSLMMLLAAEQDGGAERWLT
jgi:hypothetical protein